MSMTMIQVSIYCQKYVTSSLQKKFYAVMHRWDGSPGTAGSFYSKSVLDQIHKEVVEAND